MPITRKAKNSAAETFIGNAPDAPRERFHRGNKAQITFTIFPSMLDRVDAVANRKGISRAALITLWIGERLEQEAA